MPHTPRPLGCQSRPSRRRHDRPWGVVATRDRPALRGASCHAAYAYTAADTRMNAALTSRATVARFGTISGTVIDSDSNRVIWSKNAHHRTHAGLDRPSSSPPTTR